jgi:hypothetical protein
MKHSWNDIRVRAAAFARANRTAHYEKGETQTFYNDFFDLFGVSRQSVARYEEHVRRLDNASGFIDLFWPGTLIVEQKSAGRDLKAAAIQAATYFDALPEGERPRFQLVCDFQNFELLDRHTRQTVTFPLQDLRKHVEAFWFIRDVHAPASTRTEAPADIAAAELMGQLHDALAPSISGHDLEVFLTRIVFCLFADDTGIFDARHMLWDYLETRTADDGHDLGGKLAHLFQVLDTDGPDRSANLDADLAAFPYVNGALFDAPTRIPDFDRAMRDTLLRACAFDWTPISPAIFGSLFQSVMDPKVRREKGAHYTTEANILKVIGPLFLDDLRAELAKILTRKTDTEKRLRAFQDKLRGLTFLDPACGCGNFLIITYRELRRLELAVLRALYPTGQRVLDVKALSVVDVDQFYGIEFEEFPARIAETALWMMDHLMNIELSDAFGEVYTRIPLKRSPHIHIGDALEFDWAELLSADQCSFVMGNPPFIGAKYQSRQQREQVRRIAALGKSGGTLDYVCAWFIKAGDYIAGAGRIALVSTNSITQGEQVAQLWPLLFGRCKLEIAFAHRTFAWTSEARGKAAVHCVIVGLDRRKAERAEKRLFSYPDIKGDPVETTHAKLSPYLFDASGLKDPHLVVREESRPINGWPKLITGSKPIDDGNLIVGSDEYHTLSEHDPDLAKWLRPFVGAREFIQGSERYIFHPASIPPHIARNLRGLKSRLNAVREFRAASQSQPTQATADAPGQFHVTVIPEKPFLAIPQVSSERRSYAPIGWLQPPTIPSDKLRVLLDADETIFALLTSAMRMAWMRAITGRMKSDYMYSVGVVYNTFPLPPATDLTALDPLAQAILDARAAHPGATLADLYDPDLMPPDLRRAHTALDRAVDRLYHPRGFQNDRERVEHLFQRYEAMVKPLLAPKPRRKPRRKADAGI